MCDVVFVVVRESLVIQRVIFCGFQPLTSVEVKTRPILNTIVNKMITVTNRK